MTNGYRRPPYYGGPQGGGFYDPYRKTPDWVSGIRELLKNMQMMKQLKEEKEQRLWEREQREKEFKLSRQKADLALKDLSQGIREQEWGAKKELRLEEEAKTELTPEERKLWKYKLPVAAEPSVSREKWERQKGLIPPEKEAFISGLISDAGKRLNAYTRNVQYGRSPDLDRKVKNLNSAIQFWRGNLAIGTERKLEKDEWANILKSSDLDRLEQTGKYWEKKEIDKGVGKPPFINPEKIQIKDVGTAHLSPSGKLLWFEGKVILQNPDGSFTVKGKKYKFK